MEDDATLHAYVDGQLDAATRALVEQRLQHDPVARVLVADWRRQREQLRALHGELLDAPLPPQLLRAAGLSVAPEPVDAAAAAGPAALSGRAAGGAAGDSAAVVAQLRRRWWSEPVARQALAAGLLLMLGGAGGWWGHQVLVSPRALAAAAPTETLAHGLAREAIAAHVVYAPDARRPVEIGADQQELLLRWLSKRLGRPLKAPQLDELGWRLVGGRLLSGDTAGAAAARAQFMYENLQGQRLTLYLSVLAAPAAAASDAPLPLAEFSHAAQGVTQSFFWTEDRFGYALVADLPREALQRLVNEVHAQTGATP